MLAELRVDIQKASLVVFDVGLFFHLGLGLALLLATVRTAIEVQQGDEAGVADGDEIGTMLSALGVELVSLGDVGILAVSGIVLVYHFLRDSRALLPLHPRQGLTR